MNKYIKSISIVLLFFILVVFSYGFGYDQAISDSNVAFEEVLIELEEELTEKITIALNESYSEGYEYGYEYGYVTGRHDYAQEQLDTAMDVVGVFI